MYKFDYCLNISNLFICSPNLHLSGTCPQLSLQTISGVGIPMAVQLMMNVYDCRCIFKIKYFLPFIFKKP